MASAPSLSEDTATSYRVSLVRTGEGPAVAWRADVEELPNCSARGATPEEAVRRVWAAADRAPGPQREQVEDDAQPKAPPQHSGKLLVRMPATLHDELAQAAEREGVSLNQLITGVLAGAVEWRANDEPQTTRAVSTTPRAEFKLSGRVLRIALAANFVVVLFAAAVAITLLLVAWRGGL